MTLNNFYIAYKPKYISTNKYVQQLKKELFKGQKIGFLGTLDPLAKGLLLIATNKYNKLFDYIPNQNKGYKFEFIFGFETNSLDLESDVIKTQNVEKINLDEEFLFNHLINVTEQEIPKYSAKKYKGKKLHQYKNTETMPIFSKKVKIYNCSNLKKLSYRIYSLEALVSKGAFVRSLVKEIGTLYNNFATTLEIERNVIGNIKLKDYDFNNSKIIKIKLDKIIPFPVVKVDDLNSKNLLDGKYLNLESNAELVFIENNNKIIMLVRRYPSGYKIERNLYV